MPFAVTHLVSMLAASAGPGIELIYDGATYVGGAATPTVMTMTADGVRLRADFDSVPIIFVIDGAKHEIATFATDKSRCFRIPESAATEIQIASLRKYQRGIPKEPGLTAAQKVDLVARAEASIEAAKKPKPKRTQTFTWKQHTKSSTFTCELYDVSEAGADAGQVCLEMKGKPPATFEMTVVDGEWWRGIDTLRLLGRLPIIFERKQNGELRSRVTLRSRQEKNVDPAFFLTDKPCRPWTEMYETPKDQAEPGLRSAAFEMCKTVSHRSGAAGCLAEVERRYDACSGPFNKKESSAQAFLACLGFEAQPDPVFPPLTVLGQCEGGAIVARISAAIAKAKPWKGGDLGSARGEVMYIATTPSFTTVDVLSLRLEEVDGYRRVELELSPEAAKRFNVATGDNVGETMIFKINGETTDAKIGSAIPGPKLMIGVDRLELKDLCHGG